MSVFHILFPDTTHVESMRGCRMRPGRALWEPNAVLAPSIPSEGVACYVYGSVIKNAAGYGIWHQAVIPGFGDAVCHSVSSDGLVWRRELFNGFNGGEAQHVSNAPTVDTLKIATSPAAWEKIFQGPNNIAACLHNPVVFAPDNGDPYPGLYKIFGFTDTGYVAGFSEDGRSFRYAERSPVIPLTWYPNPNTGKKWANDVGIPFWDEKKQRYVGLIKTYEIDEQGRTRRCIGFTESPDLIEWQPVRTIWTPGREADEIARADGFHWADFYGMPSFLYGDGYLGFLWIFRIESELPKGTHLGKVQVYLAWSKDAEHWELVSREPLLANPPDGEWGCGSIHTASLPVREPEHEKIYFGTSDALHGAWEIKRPPLGKHPMSIGLATLPRNGFCRAWAESGEFVVPVPPAAGSISVTLSSDERAQASHAEIVCGERRLFSGDVHEGQREMIDLPEEIAGPLQFRLENAGVYAIEFEPRIV